MRFHTKSFNKSIDILTDKPIKTLIFMSLPISIGLVSILLFQIIDTYFVGKLGVQELTALIFSSSFFILINGLFSGLSIGVSIAVSQALGLKKRSKALKIIQTSMLFSLVLGILISWLSIVFIDPLFTLLGASEEILPLIRDYNIPILYGIPIFNMAIIASGCLRADGIVIKPEVFNIVIIVINILLDYTLIFGQLGMPELGIKGAAYGTVFSWLLMALGMFTFLFRNELLIFKKIKTYTNAFVLKEVKKISAPIILIQIIGPITFIYINFLLSKQSSLAVAAYGIAGRIETFFMVGIYALSIAIVPFIAQNFAAKQKSRIKNAISFGSNVTIFYDINLC